MKYEALLKEAGGFGKHQIIMLVWYQLTLWMMCPTMIFMVFGAYRPPKCLSNSFNDTTTNNETLMNISIVNMTSNICQQSKFYSIATEWQLEKSWVSIITSIQMIGVFFGPLVGGQLSDTFGRRKTFVVTFAFLLLFSVLSGFSPRWEWFAAARFFIGFTAGSCISVHYVLMQELLPPKWRLIVYVGGWPLAYLAASIFAAATRDWRLLSWALGAFGLIPLSLAIFWLTESPKWLLEKKRHAEAEAVLGLIAKRNGRVDLKVTSDYFDRLVSEAETELGQVKVATYSYWHLFTRSRRDSIETVTLICSWFTTSFCSYTIVFNISNLHGDPAVMTALLGVFRVPIVLIGLFLDRKIFKFGRRLMHRIGLIGLGLCMLALGATLFWKFGLKWGSSIWSLAAMSFCTFVWTAVELYTSELFPTALRNMGNAACNSSARIGSTLAPFLLLLTPGVPFFALTILVSINLLAVWQLLPETKGRPLPDMPTAEETL